MVKSNIFKDIYLNKVSKSQTNKKESDYKEGWKISKGLNGYIDGADKLELLAIDCEMCKTEGGDSELARISIINSKQVLLNEYVLLERGIIDYLPKFSGITEKHLRNVTTRLSDIHKLLDSLIGPNTVLIGLSLERDFKAMKFIHRKVIDTAILYKGSNGKKIGLKYLAKTHLGRSIQNLESGHNSIEDAEAALDLVKLKNININQL